MAELPIIVLAFANDQEGRRYLRDLPEEVRRLQEILKEAERNGLCRLELLPNATLDQLFDVFTRNCDLVTILHYAGHADSGRLLLESSVPGGSPVNAAGLATFLGQRRGLQLVFLNGCSTRAQAARLLDAGVASVITTARAIDDGVAREFAIAFYKELASGAPLRAAYEASRGRLLTVRGEDPKVYYQSRDIGTAATKPADPDSSDDYGFPWEFRPGTELVERWSLPDAAGNPEFGLPHFPERDLPESPFRNLAWFTEEHAEVFFGRGYQVRELYEQVTDPSGPPILLLYGTSGVGKSSLLDAGLVPRLKTGGHAVRYRRRDQQKGLTGTLRDALQLADEAPSLAGGWRTEEARICKPLVVFLDQVEEVFTRPALTQPRELDDFVAALVDCLGNREGRPRGKLVCGFRKEWLAEIDRRLAEAKLPRAKVFLKPLDRRGIIEAISAPARPGRLQRHFRLSIEAGLPEAIAEDLLADAGSALAPTLQVLLTKMWERARQSNPDDPRFDRVLYETLKAQGYLLKDVLEEGLEAIAAWNPTVAESGLPLDVLVYHTTDLGTASQRTRTALDERYSHQADKLDGLLACCKDRYLTIETEPNPGSPDRSIRLAHDLLAPLVQHRFRVSIAPGQLARRFLENRAPEWQNGREGPVLDSTDLRSVEAGASGMRAWTPDEARLVEESRRAEEREKAEEREQARRIQAAEDNQRKAEVERQRAIEQRLKEQEESNRRLRRRAVALGATLAATLAVATLAAYAWRASVKAKNDAETQTGIAKHQASIAESRRLASLSQLAIADRLDVAMLLALEASAPAKTQESIASLQIALEARPELRSFRHVPEGEVRSVAFGPKGEIAAGYAGNGGGGVVIFDASGSRLRPDPLEVIKEGYVDSVAFGPKGEIAAGYSSSDSSSSGVVIFDASGSQLRPNPLEVIKGRYVKSVAFGPKGEIAAGYAGNGGGGVVVFDASGSQLRLEPLEVKEGNVGSVAFGPKGEIAAGYGRRDSSSSGVVVFDASGSRLRPEPLEVKEGGNVTSVAIGPKGEIAAGYAGSKGGVVVFDASGSRLRPEPLEVKEGNVGSVDFGPKGEIAAGYSGSGAVGGVVLFDASGSRLYPAPLVVQEGYVTRVALGSKGEIAAGYDAGSKGGVVIFDGSGSRLLPVPLLVREGKVESVDFGPKGEIAAGYASGNRGGVMVFDLDPVSWRKKAERTANRNLTWQEWKKYFPDSKYHRTVRAFPWPHDLPEAEREQAELYEREHPEGSDVS